MDKIKLTIILDPKTGKLDVDGPIKDQILCLGMLEMAKSVVTANISVSNKKE